MSIQSDLSGRMTKLETKFDAFYTSMTEVKKMIEKLAEVVQSEHAEEMTKMKSNHDFMERNIQKLEKRMSWIIGMLWSFLSLIALAVLSSVLNGVLG